MKDVTAHDLVKYGIIPELIGRLPVITALSGLDTDALVQILTVPKNTSSTLSSSKSFLYC